MILQVDLSNKYLHMQNFIKLKSLIYLLNLVTTGKLLRNINYRFVKSTKNINGYKAIQIREMFPQLLMNFQENLNSIS